MQSICCGAATAKARLAISNVEAKRAPAQIGFDTGLATGRFRRLDEAGSRDIFVSASNRESAIRKLNLATVQFEGLWRLDQELASVLTGKNCGIGRGLARSSGNR